MRLDNDTFTVKYLLNGDGPIGAVAAGAVPPHTCYCQVLRYKDGRRVWDGVTDARKSYPDWPTALPAIFADPAKLNRAAGRAAVCRPDHAAYIADLCGAMPNPGGNTWLAAPAASAGTTANTLPRGRPVAPAGTSRPSILISHEPSGEGGPCAVVTSGYPHHERTGSAQETSRGHDRVGAVRVRRAVGDRPRCGPPAAHLPSAECRLPPQRCGRRGTR